MNVEREVTDLLQVSLSVFILSLILISENSEFSENTLLFSGLTLLVLLTFVHIILVQLDVITVDHSRFFALAAIIPLLMTLIGFLGYDLQDPNGFWDDIGISFTAIFTISILSLITVTIISIFSKRAEI
jgi:hypothetical protein